MAKYDLLIRNGLVVDGTGAPPVHADIAIAGGRIAEVGQKLNATAAHEVLDADGHIVTPGWIDPHTHFDGQATWDDRMDPVFGHGTTTAIMGNCGVGFAPVRPGSEKLLIDIMEGVEDIPFGTLHEAMPWGEWESFPDYLAVLRGRQYGVDLGAQIPLGAMRAYVMGADDPYRKQASAEEIDVMSRMVTDAIKAGALGMSTSRVVGHRAMSSGEPVPGTFASEQELTQLVCAMSALGKGVLQVIPGSSFGTSAGNFFDPCTTEQEISMLARISRKSGRPVTFTTFQVPEEPDEWRRTLQTSVEENRNGAKLHPQVAARPPGVLLSLGGYHPLMRRASYLQLVADLPLAQRVSEMTKPQVKAAILASADVPHEKTGSAENFVVLFLRNIMGSLAPLGPNVNYEPEPGVFVKALASERGESEQSVVYDLLLEQDGNNVLMLALSNYVHGNLDAVYEMFTHPTTVSGLGDAGAHSKFISDASLPTFVLSHFVMGRTRGPRIPLEAAVAKLTARTADVYGLADRGRLICGKRADLNVIDLANVRLELPQMHYDMPLGAGRLLQKAHGYRATLVNGVTTRINGTDTGKRPGRLVNVA
jgi:N-acyl-D-amino-acid deacylase